MTNSKHLKSEVLSVDTIHSAFQDAKYFSDGKLYLEKIVNVSSFKIIFPPVLSLFQYALLHFATQ